MSKLKTTIKNNTILKNKISAKLKNSGYILNEKASLINVQGTNSLLNTNKNGGLVVSENQTIKSNSVGSIGSIPNMDTKLSTQLGELMTHYNDAYIQGGYRVVTTLTERDNIDCCYRKQGMKAVVIGQDFSYKEYVLLSDDCDENEWTEISIDEDEVILVGDYSRLGIDLRTQKDLNQKLQDLILEFEQLDIPTNTSELVNDGPDGLNPFITAQDVPEQVNSDWEATSGPAEILNKPVIGEADKNYVHDQAVPKSIWTIDHTLNKKVSITITDTAGTVVEGQVTINNGNKVVIEFNFPFSGEAILN